MTEGKENNESIYAGRLERPGPDGKYHRVSVADVVRPLGTLIREALGIEDSMVMFKKNVYMSLICVGLVGAFLVTTRAGGAVQQMLGMRPTQVPMPSFASLLQPSEDAPQKSLEVANQTSLQLNFLHAAGLTGDYTRDLSLLLGARYPASLVDRAIKGQRPDKASAVFGYGQVPTCKEGEADCEAVQQALANGAKPEDLVVSQQAIDGKVLEVRSMGKGSLSQPTCDAWAKGGFYGQHKTLKFSPFVYANAMSRDEAKAVMTAINQAWKSGLIDPEMMKRASVNSLRELFSHRREGSCVPLPVTVYELDGASTKYLVSILVSGANKVGAALYMAYDLDDLGVQERGLKRLKERDLSDPASIDGVAEVMSFSAQGTLQDISRQMKREGMSIDPSTKPDLAAQSAAIQPK